MKRTLLVLLGLVMILATVGAQGSQEPQKSGPVTLKYAFWGNPDAIGYADYHTKLMTMIAGNRAFLWKSGCRSSTGARKRRSIKKMSKFCERTHIVIYVQTGMLNTGKGECYEKTWRCNYWSG
jgi:hypothetical protein